MKIKTFDNIDQIHQIWNNSTWIRYNTILNEMGMIDLTPEQEEALFPEVPDDFIIGDKVYEPTIADHVEYYSGKVDGCSYYRITLKEHNYHILVHCEAGVSRSQAVGACLELYVNNDASNIERRIHSGNYTYFQTFFQQFNNEWKALGDLQEPIYQEANNNENLFGFRYKMNDYEEHQLRRGAFGPEYPRSRMLGLTDRINLARLTN